jgi:hypothetical protein
MLVGKRDSISRGGGLLHTETKTGVDGKWVGANLLGTYFYFEVDPGVVRLCSTGAHPSVLLVSAKADERHYVLERGGSNQELVEIPEDAATKFLRNCKLSTFELKQKGGGK